MNCTSTLLSVENKPQINHVDIALEMYLLLWFLNKHRRILSQLILFIIPVSEVAQCIQYFVIRKAYFTDESLPARLPRKLTANSELKYCSLKFKLVSLFNNFVFRIEPQILTKMSGQ